MPETENMTNPETAQGADFRMFIQKLAMQGFYALGLIDIPGAPKGEPNVDIARMVCDDLMLLREKTESNLDDGERMTLDKFISDLQFQILNAPKSETEGGCCGSHDHSDEGHSHGDDHECCGAHDHGDEQAEAAPAAEAEGESGCCGSCQ